MAEIQDPRERLRLEFCPPIDEPLFYAICFDYDLENQDGLEDCLSNLRKLKEDTDGADTTFFDASGTGAFADQDSDVDLQEAGEPWSIRNGAAAVLQEPGPSRTPQSDRASDDPFAESQCLDEASEGARATELKEMFPNISEDKIIARLRKCDGNFTRALDELLNFGFMPRSIDGFEQFDFQDSRQKGGGRRRRRQKSLSQSSFAVPAGPQAPTGPMKAWSSMARDTSPSSLELVTKYPPIDLNSRSHPIAGNSRSSPLWGQVNHAKASGTSTGKRADAKATEALVKAHSSPDMLDLHGFIVADAVALAREHANSWWQSLGDRKYATGGGGPVREGYRIVTGAGHHSKNGSPKIRPAVVRALVGDGWRIVDDQGEVFVTGRARRS